jgi:hypothetical protein
MLDPESTGGTAITGYKLYMYSGIPMATKASSNVISQEVQTVTVSIGSKIPEIQKITLEGYKQGYIGLTIHGQYKKVAVNADRNIIATAIREMMTSLGKDFCMQDCVHVENDYYGGGDVRRTWTVTFSDVDGPVDLIDVDSTINDAVANQGPENTIKSSVVVVQSGTQGVSGSFSLNYSGYSTIDLPFDATSADVKAALEDTGAIGSISVLRSRNLADGIDRGAYIWSITFDSLAGDLPMIEAYGGRLGPIASGVSIAVNELISGTPATLIYDGIGNPNQRKVNVVDLIPGETYAFKVAPINAIGQGVLSGASNTVKAASGASASSTLVSGTTLTSGMVDSIHEVQIISAEECTDNDKITISWDGKETTFIAADSAERVEFIIERVLMAGDVTVDRHDTSPGLNEWFVTFAASGDISAMTVTSDDVNCKVSVSEFLNGNRNEFIIEPRDISGLPVDDSTWAIEYQGQDVFSVETVSVDGTWSKSQGLATYSPVLNEIQNVFIPESMNTNLSLSNYLIPDSLEILHTSLIKSSDSELDVEARLNAISIIGNNGVTVTKSTNNDGTNFAVTFVSNAGDVPMLTPSNPRVLITEVQKGVTEVQTITIVADTAVVKEVQALVLEGYNNETVGSLNFTFGGKSTLPINYPSNTFVKDLEDALNTIVDPVLGRLSVSVSQKKELITAYAMKETFHITFNGPVGNIPMIVPQKNW